MFFGIFRLFDAAGIDRPLRKACHKPGSVLPVV